MKHKLDVSELNERIEKNYHRFEDDYYSIHDIFQPDDAAWPGDKEGRALLAFVSHYRISGRKIPCMEQMLAELSERTGGKMYFPSHVPDVIDEQQLSGHSWLLRGLCEHYLAFGDDFSKDALQKIIDELYLPLIGHIKDYPATQKARDQGGVSGNSLATVSGWLLSTDTGCAFMALDGLSAAYEILQDDRIRVLYEEMADKFASIDKAGLYLQTHCTLSAARGMIRMYQLTKEERYFTDAVTIFDTYVNHDGMTLTYQNKNWWHADGTWTEPCAIVDSFILAMELYKITKDEDYRIFAVRVYLNGFATSQRDNGGAGTDSIVTSTDTILSPKLYEAYFCCTMRIAEGFRYLYENIDLFEYQTNGEITKDLYGRYFDGDVLLCEVIGEYAEKYAVNARLFDGHRLIPIPKFYRIPKSEMEKLQLQIVFE